MNTRDAKSSIRTLMRWTAQPLSPHGRPDISIFQRCVIGYAPRCGGYRAEKFHYLNQAADQKIRSVYISQVKHDRLLLTSARTLASWVSYWWIKPRHQIHHLGLTSSEFFLCRFSYIYRALLSFSTLQSTPFEPTDTAPLWQALVGLQPRAHVIQGVFAKRVSAEHSHLCT